MTGGEWSSLSNYRSYCELGEAEALLFGFFFTQPDIYMKHWYVPFDFICYVVRVCACARVHACVSGGFLNFFFFFHISCNEKVEQVASNSWNSLNWRSA